MPTVDDLINFAIGQQPTKFASAFDDIMGEKTIAAVEAMREKAAQGIYAAEDDLEDLDEPEDDDDIEDIDSDIDDDEFDDIEDLELDDDDFDLDDSDLEGLDDGEDA